MTDLVSLQTQPIPQLITTLLFALEQPNILQTISNLSHPTIITRLQTISKEEYDKSIQDQCFIISKLLLIFSAGTSSNLVQLFEEQQEYIEPICSLITPLLYLNLQLITLISIIEQILFSPSYLSNAILTQPAFPHIPFNTIYNHLMVNHQGEKLLNFFKKNSKKFEILGYIEPESVLTLITTGFSYQILGGILHNVISDNLNDNNSDAYLELRTLNYRPIISIENENKKKILNDEEIKKKDEKNSTTIVSIKDMIAVLDVLINAVDTTAQVV